MCQDVNLCLQLFVPKRVCPLFPFLLTQHIGSGRLQKLRAETLWGWHRLQIHSSKRLYAPLLSPDQSALSTHCTTLKSYCCGQSPVERKQNNSKEEERPRGNGSTGRKQCWAMQSPAGSTAPAKVAHCHHSSSEIAVVQLHLQQGQVRLCFLDSSRHRVGYTRRPRL
jgi:hypothetical protein